MNYHIQVSFFFKDLVKFYLRQGFQTNICPGFFNASSLENIDSLVVEIAALFSSFPLPPPLYLSLSLSFVWTFGISIPPYNYKLASTTERSYRWKITRSGTHTHLWINSFRL